jgi:hypothetical protein
MKKFPVDLPNRTPVALADQVLINNSATNTTSYSTVQQIYTAASLLALLNIGANNRINDAGDSYFKGGNIGIGNTTPSTLLDVGSNVLASNSYIKINSAAGNEAGYSWYSAGVGKWFMYRPSGSNDLRIFDTQDRVTFQTGGFVGIGITAPLSRLQIKEDGITHTLLVGRTGGFASIKASAIDGNMVIDSYDNATSVAIQNYSGGKVELCGGLGHLNIKLAAVPIYANNAAAVGGGLISGDVYRTGADPDHLCIVH